MSEDDTDHSSIIIEGLTSELSLELQQEVIEKEMTTNDVRELEGPSTSIEIKPLGDPNKDETIL